MCVNFLVSGRLCLRRFSQRPQVPGCKEAVDGSLEASQGVQSGAALKAISGRGLRGVWVIALRVGLDPKAASGVPCFLWISLEASGSCLGVRWVRWVRFNWTRQRLAPLPFFFCHRQTPFGWRLDLEGPRKVLVFTWVSRFKTAKHPGGQPHSHFPGAFSWLLLGSMFLAFLLIVV